VYPSTWTGSPIDWAAVVSTPGLPSSFLHALAERVRARVTFDYAFEIETQAQRDWEAAGYPCVWEGA
jgi:hypothetical protein